MIGFGGGLWKTPGDDRLRQCDIKSLYLLFGIAMVPVTHLLHPIIANFLVSKANAIADNVLARLGVPQFAMA